MSELKVELENEKKLLGALGLCARARKLVFGVPMICEAMKSGGKNAVASAAKNTIGVYLRENFVINFSDCDLWADDDSTRFRILASVLSA